MTPAQCEFAESIATYVCDQDGELSPHDAAMAAVSILLDDIGAAQGYCDALGLKVDLFGQWP